MSLNVVEVFNSIEGEGIRAGMPATFIRLAGCNLRCSYCDTKYAQRDDDGNLMSIKDVIKHIKFNAVTITGGEPLLHSHELITLLDILNDGGYYINIETNGSIDIMPFIPAVRKGKGFFTIDYKCPCSGMEDKMLKSNFLALDKNDVVKFVVAGSDDISSIREFLDEFKSLKCVIYISPCFSKISLDRLAEHIKLLKLDYPKFDIRMQVQLHKVIWNPDERGV